jgi:hypothetical protein
MADALRIAIQRSPFRVEAVEPYDDKIEITVNMEDEKHPVTEIDEKFEQLVKTLFQSH